MENGWVYWSNWFGLDAVTSNIQVQRGLGASKIAIPSVGGTMNILTRGIGNKAGGSVKQSVGSFGRLRTSLGYNSGRLENGWGYTLAGSYKKGNGFVEETWSEGFFYYAKIQKLPVTEKQMLNIQRKFELNDNIYTYLLEKRAEAGIAKASNIPDNKIIDRALVQNAGSYKKVSELDLTQDEKESLSHFKYSFFEPILYVNVEIIKGELDAKFSFEYNIKTKKGTNFIYEI
jgi:hypothetical protein